MSSEAPAFDNFIAGVIPRASASLILAINPRSQTTIHFVPLIVLHIRNSREMNLDFRAVSEGNLFKHENSMSF